MGITVRIKFDKDEDDDADENVSYVFNGNEIPIKNDPIVHPNRTTDTITTVEKGSVVRATITNFNGLDTPSAIWNALTDSYLTTTDPDNYQIERAEVIISPTYAHRFNIKRQYKTINNGGNGWVDVPIFYKSKTFLFTPGTMKGIQDDLVVKINLRAVNQIDDTAALQKNYRQKSNGVKIWDDLEPNISRNAGDKLFFLKALELIDKPAGDDFVVASAFLGQPLYADVKVHAGKAKNKDYCIGELESANRDDAWIYKTGSGYGLDFQDGDAEITADSTRSLRQYAEWESSKECVAQNSKDTCLTSDCAAGGKVPCPGAMYTEWVSAKEDAGEATLRCYYNVTGNLLKDELEDTAQHEAIGPTGENVYKQLLNGYCDIPGNSFKEVASGSTNTCQKVTEKTDALEASCARGDTVATQFTECKTYLEPTVFDSIMTNYCERHRGTSDLCGCYNLANSDAETYCPANPDAPGCDVYNRVLTGVSQPGFDAVAEMFKGKPYCSTGVCSTINTAGNWTPAVVRDTACPDNQTCIQGITAGNLDQPAVKQSCTLSSETGGSGGGGGGDDDEGGGGDDEGGDDDDEGGDKTKLYIGIGVGVCVCIILVIVMMTMSRQGRRTN